MRKSFFVKITLFFLLISTGVQAQQTEKFSVATLNVDGLPKKILIFNVNADGPGDEGTSRIGKYLMQKNFDIVCMQEDFNYHGVLTPWLEDTHKFDTWSGAVGIDLPGKKIDFLHAQNERFDCDGLGACWKNNIMVTSSERVKWESSFGKFSHEADELVTKGFRRYEATLPSGIQLLIYNMHMDASSMADEKEGKDSMDLAARQNEWQQLKNDVLAHLDSRPILVMGDLNSYYCRDHIKKNFIDEIAATGKGVASDVWIELVKGGQYPDPVDSIVCYEKEDYLLDGEVLDKIIYINPVSGIQIKPTSVTLDKEGYLYNGKPLGEHYPLSATFEVLRSKPSAIETSIQLEPSKSDATYYDLQGHKIAQPSNGLYIERDGRGAQKKIIK